MAKYAGTDDKSGPVSEEEAMQAFSAAKLAGIKIMDLPDAPKSELPAVDDSQAALIYQANEQERQKTSEEPAAK